MSLPPPCSARPIRDCQTRIFRMCMPDIHRGRRCSGYSAKARPARKRIFHPASFFQVFQPRQSVRNREPRPLRRAARHMQHAFSTCSKRIFQGEAHFFQTKAFRHKAFQPQPFHRYRKRRKCPRRFPLFYLYRSYRRTGFRLHKPFRGQSGAPSAAD